MQQKETI